jgi:hypothetical protein
MQTALNKLWIDVANLNMDCRRTEGREQCDEWGSDQLNDGHLSVVAATGHCTNDPCVATASIPVAIQSFIEEGMYELLIVDIANRPASRSKTTFLSQSDHALCLITKGFGTGLGGGYTTLTNQLGRKTP